MKKRKPKAEIKVEIWQHKDNGKKCRAVPWWEVLEPDEVISGQMKNLGVKDKFPERKFKIGALTQVGWLLENEGGVFIGVGLKAKKHFRVVG